MPFSHCRFSQVLYGRWALVGAVLFSAQVWAGPVLQRIHSQGELRVCIWPDYYGVTWRNPRNHGLSGIDIDLSQALAKDLKVKLRHVDSSFAKLIDDLKENRCDVAMHAVGVIPQRQQHLAFSEPYLRSGIYAITTRSNPLVKKWTDIDRPGVAVAVQAGTFMEPVMAQTLKQARLVVVRPPQTREEELESGRVDVFMTDYPYSRRLLDNADWARLIEPEKPFSPVNYAYAIKPGDEEWLALLNKFVSSIKADGRLISAARRYNLLPIVVRD
jgi:cyclohexadienyl dehydratase